MHLLTDGEEDVLTRVMAVVLRVHADRYRDADAINVLLEAHRVVARVISQAGLDPNAEDDGGKTPLHCAADSGDGDVIEALQAAGADLNARDVQGKTPLHHAVRAALDEEDRVPLEATPNGRASPMSGYRRRSRVRCMEAVRALLDAGADPNARAEDETYGTPHGPGETPLHYAADRGHAEIVRALLEAGAEPNVWATWDPTPDGVGETPLHHAAHRGHAEVVRVLLGAGAEFNARAIDDGTDRNPNRVRQTPMHHAAHSGHDDVIAVLRAAGADVNAGDSHRETPLHYAVHWDRADAVRALLKAGADPNATDNAGRSPLHHAPPAHRRLRRDHGRAEAVRAVLEAGARPDAKDGDGGTPLHHAAKVGNTEAVRALLETGACPNATDDDGRTPLHHALPALATSKPSELSWWLAPIRAYGITTVRLLCTTRSTGTTLMSSRLSFEGDFDPTAMDDDGETLLHYAARKGSAAAIRALLEAGFDPTAMDDDGKTPLDLASSRGQGDVIEALRAAGVGGNAAGL